MVEHVLLKLVGFCYDKIIMLQTSKAKMAKMCAILKAEAVSFFRGKSQVNFR